MNYSAVDSSRRAGSAEPGRLAVRGRLGSMGLLLLAGSLALALMDVRPEGAVATFSNYYGETYHDTIVTKSQLRETPPWTEDSEHPPLSQRREISLARAYLPNLVDGADKWRLGDVILKQVGDGDRWIYLVGFISPGFPMEWSRPCELLS